MIIVVKKMTIHVNQLQFSLGNIHFQKIILENSKLKSLAGRIWKKIYKFSLIFSMILWFSGRIINSIIWTCPGVICGVPEPPLNLSSSHVLWPVHYGRRDLE